MALTVEMRWIQWDRQTEAVDAYLIKRHEDWGSRCLPHWTAGTLNQSMLTSWNGRHVEAVDAYLIERQAHWGSRCLRHWTVDTKVVGAIIPRRNLTHTEHSLKLGSLWGCVNPASFTICSVLAWPLASLKKKRLTTWQARSWPADGGSFSSHGRRIIHQLLHTITQLIDLRSEELLL